MDEFLKLLYKNFIDVENGENNKSIDLINSSWDKMNEILKGLEETMNEKLFDKLSDDVMDGINDIQEANFIAGFSYCAKFMSNGKIDFMGK